MDVSKVLEAVKAVEEAATRLNSVLEGAGISVEVGRLYRAKYGEPYETRVLVSCDVLSEFGEPTWYPVGCGIGFVGEVEVGNVKFAGASLSLPAEMGEVVNAY